MHIKPEELKLSLWRAILRLLPLILMGILTLLTYWLVQKSNPEEPSPLAKIRLHEPDYTIKNGALSALNEIGNTKYRVLADY